MKRPCRYYMIVRKKSGNPITFGEQLPIFWYKKTAERKLEEYATSDKEKFKIIPVNI